MDQPGTYDQASADIALGQTHSAGWTPERVGRLSALWALGASAREVGDDLKISRCAAISKIHRLGLKRDPAINLAHQDKARELGRKKTGKTAPRKSPRKSPPKRDRADAARPGANMKTTHCQPVVRLAGALPESRPVDIMGLDHSTCRWPLDGEPMMYCGAVSPDDKPYCAAHHARSISYAIKRPTSAKELVRSVRRFL